MKDVKPKDCRKCRWYYAVTGETGSCLHIRVIEKRIWLPAERGTRCGYWIFKNFNVERR